VELPRAPQRITVGFSFSYIERVLQEGLASRQFGKAEMKRVLDFFDNDPPQCVYCGSLKVRRWDHLVPVSEGGETRIGNMVPACALCDDSKRHLPFEEWMLSDAWFSPKSRHVPDLGARIEDLKAYVQHFEYAPSKLEERLVEDELARLRTIRAALADVRSDIEGLIGDYRARTSSR
jgi:hypothetical protein